MRELFVSPVLRLIVAIRSPIDVHSLHVIHAMRRHTRPAPLSSVGHSHICQGVEYRPHGFSSRSLAVRHTGEQPDQRSRKWACHIYLCVSSSCGINPRLRFAH